MTNIIIKPLLLLHLWRAGYAASTHINYSRILWVGLPCQPEQFSMIYGPYSDCRRKRMAKDGKGAEGDAAAFPSINNSKWNAIPRENAKGSSSWLPGATSPATVCGRPSCVSSVCTAWLVHLSVCRYWKSDFMGFYFVWLCADFQLLSHSLGVHPIFLRSSF